MENSEDLAAQGLLSHVELSSGYPFSSRAGDFKLVPPLPAAVLTPGPLQSWTWPVGPCRHILSGHCAVRRRSGHTVSNWPTLKVKGDCVFPFPQLCAVFIALWISRAWGHQNPELKSLYCNELAAAHLAGTLPPLPRPVILMPRPSSPLCTVPGGLPRLMYFWFFIYFLFLKLLLFFN